MSNRMNNDSRLLHSDGSAECVPGSVVDRRYVVGREIARGGMGVVVEAKHTTLRSTVALKTLTARAMESVQQHARLMREARALSMVKHPGISEVLDAGICSTFGPYLVLEMIDGRSLDGLIVAKQRLDVDSALAIVSQLAEALSAVHARGVIHRDVKPGNVLVTHGAGATGDRLKLIDFGIACVHGDDDVVERKLTCPGDVLGTVEYMAPEHLLDGMPPTPLSDVYALGALVYECLMGDVPFPGPARTIMSTMLAGARPASICQRRQDVPLPLEAAIMRALSRDRQARFGTVTAFKEACCAALGRRPRPLALVEVPRPALDGASRRRFVRAPYVTPVRVIGSSEAWDGRTEDVSEGGLLVVTSVRHAKEPEAPSEGSQEGQRVSVRLPLPSSGRVVVIDAIACWARTQRGQRAIGISFVALADDVREEIRNYVSLMARDGSPEVAAPKRDRAA